MPIVQIDPSNCAGGVACFGSGVWGGGPSGPGGGMLVAVRMSISACVLSLVVPVLLSCHYIFCMFVWGLLFAQHFFYIIMLLRYFLN